MNKETPSLFKKQLVYILGGDNELRKILEELHSEQSEIIKQCPSLKDWSKQQILIKVLERINGNG